MVINRVRVLGSGPHTPTQFFWEYPPGWNFSPDRVKRETIILLVDKGGLNMVDFTIMNKSLRAAWVKRFHEADGSKCCSALTSASVTAQVDLFSNAIMIHAI